jgi:hypothetical protein
VLETLSLMISANPLLLQDQSSLSSRLVHEFLANAGRQLEASSAREGERDKTSRQVQMVMPNANWITIDVFIFDGNVKGWKNWVG